MSEGDYTGHLCLHFVSACLAESLSSEATSDHRKCGSDMGLGYCLVTEKEGSIIAQFLEVSVHS